MADDIDPRPNPLAEELRDRYGVQLNAVLDFVDCTTDGPSGLAGTPNVRTARDGECKRAWVKVEAGFNVDITGDIAQDVINGLHKIAGSLEEDAEQLQAAVARGKFTKQA